MSEKKRPPHSRQQLIFAAVALVLLLVAYLAFGDSLLSPEDSEGYYYPTDEGISYLEETQTPTVKPTKSPKATASPTTAPIASDASEAAETELGGELTVYVLDVGQADSILLISPSGKTMLVDAGDGDAFDVIDAKLKELAIGKLDVVVATHPHSDHIGSMRKVINNYKIGTFYMPNVEHTSSTFTKMLTALENNSVKVRQAEAKTNGSTVIKWDDDVTVRVLSPVVGVDYEDDYNNWSVVLHVEYGETSMLLTGDLETSAEKTILDTLPNEYLKSTVLKMGHHGSSTSTSTAFFEAVSPEIAVISVGANNDYGHPHKETLKLLKKTSTPYYRTDECGTITLTFNGKTVSVSTEK